MQPVMPTLATTVYEDCTSCCGVCPTVSYQVDVAGVNATICMGCQDKTGHGDASTSSLAVDGSYSCSTFSIYFDGIQQCQYVDTHDLSPLVTLTTNEYTTTDGSCSAGGTSNQATTVAVTVRIAPADTLTPLRAVRIFCESNMTSPLQEDPPFDWTGTAAFGDTLPNQILPFGCPVGGSVFSRVYVADGGTVVVTEV